MRALSSEPAGLATSRARKLVETRIATGRAKAAQWQNATWPAANTRACLAGHAAARPGAAKIDVSVDRPVVDPGDKVKITLVTSADRAPTRRPVKDLSVKLVEPPEASSAT
jgi:hypothetical protein